MIGISKFQWTNLNNASKESYRINGGGGFKSEHIRLAINILAITKTFSKYRNNWYQLY